MPEKIIAGRHPGATDEETIGFPFGVEGNAVTELIPLCAGPARLGAATSDWGWVVPLKSPEILHVSRCL
jgi:hypothetical protein